MIYSIINEYFNALKKKDFNSIKKLLFKKNNYKRNYPTYEKPRTTARKGFLQTHPKI